jgi:hypothetical protein
MNASVRRMTLAASFGSAVGPARRNPDCVAAWLFFAPFCPPVAPAKLYCCSLITSRGLSVIEHSRHSSAPIPRTGETEEKQLAAEDMRLRGDQEGDGTEVTEDMYGCWVWSLRTPISWMFKPTHKPAVTYRIPDQFVPQCDRDIWVEIALHRVSMREFHSAVSFFRLLNEFASVQVVSSDVVAAVCVTSNSTFGSQRGPNK